MEIKEMKDKDDKVTNYVEGNNVYILGGFDDSISQNVIVNLVNLINDLPNLANPEINFFINSNGGRADILFSLLGLIDIAKSKGIKINTYVIGSAYSCGSMLAVVGDCRKMSRYSTHLMHYGSQTYSMETMEQIKRSNKTAMEHFNRVAEIYLEHTKLTLNEIKAFLQDDMMFLNPRECIEYGLCDEIMGGVYGELIDPDDPEYDAKMDKLTKFMAKIDPNAPKDEEIVDNTVENDTVEETIEEPAEEVSEKEKKKGKKQILLETDEKVDEIIL